MRKGPVARWGPGSGPWLDSPRSSALPTFPEVICFLGQIHFQWSHRSQNVNFLVYGEKCTIKPSSIRQWLTGKTTPCQKAARKPEHTHVVSWRGNSVKESVDALLRFDRLVSLAPSQGSHSQTHQMTPSAEAAASPWTLLWQTTNSFSSRLPSLSSVQSMPSLWSQSIPRQEDVNIGYPFTRP